MPNTFQYADWLTMESLRLLKNKLTVAKFFNTDINKEYAREFPVGETVRVKLPQRFTIREGIGYSPQPITRIFTTVTLDQIFGVDFEWDSAEAALKAERGQEAVRREYIEPAMAQIAQEIDSRAARWAYQNASLVVGALGTDPTALSTIGAVRQKLIEQSCPPEGKKGLIIAPNVNTALVDAFKGLFQDGDAIARQYTEGYLGRLQGFDVFESMSLYRHTAGTWASAVTVNGANQSGSTLVVSCTSGDTFRRGDKISIAGVLPVNPMTRRAYGTAPKTFTILQDVTASGTSATLTISPAIYGPGSQYQNVSALPANGAALTLWPGTSSPNGKSGTVNVAIHEDAFALVGVKLELPKSAELASQTRDPQTGLSVRFVRMFDPQLSRMINRFDVLLGFGNLYPDSCAVAIASA
jgi:hypothetical protein